MKEEKMSKKFRNDRRNERKARLTRSIPSDTD